MINIRHLHKSLPVIWIWISPAGPCNTDNTEWPLLWKTNQNSSIYVQFLNYSALLIKFWCDICGFIIIIIIIIIKKKPFVVHMLHAFYPWIHPHEKLMCSHIQVEERSAADEGNTSIKFSLVSFHILKHRSKNSTVTLNLLILPY